MKSEKTMSFFGDLFLEASMFLTNEKKKEKRFNLIDSRKNNCLLVPAFMSSQIFFRQRLYPNSAST